MPTIQVNDIHMYYEIHGEGRPLVLIGGLANDLSELETITRWLAQSYQVLVFDNRGVGRTDKPDIPYSIEMMADDMAKLLHALGIQRTSVLGISMGGRIALDFALQHPERVERLLLVSTSARVINSRRRQRRLRFMRLLSGLLSLKSKYPQPPYAFLRQFQALNGYNCVDRLQELRMPTLIMHGKKDQAAPYALAEEMHAGIRGSQMSTFQGGHIFFFFAERQRFLEEIVKFMEGQIGNN